MNDILFYAAALALGGLAGTRLTDKDPVGIIQRQLQQHRGFILAVIGVGFVTGLLWDVLRG